MVGAATIRTFVAAAAAIGLAGCSSPIAGTPIAEPPPVVSVEERAAAETKKAVQRYLDDDPATGALKLTVTQVLVIHVDGNEYRGMATVRTYKGTTRDAPVSIIVDGDNYIWESDKEGYQWVFDDGYPPGTIDEPTVIPGAEWISITTASGKTKCQLSTVAVQCSVDFSPVKYNLGERVIGFQFDGGLQWMVGEPWTGNEGQIDYGFYRANEWTIEASIDGTRFTDGDGDWVFVNTSGVTTG